MAEVSVLNIATFEGDEALKTMRKTFTEWKAQGLQVCKIEAFGDFKIHGEFDVDFDDDDGQEVHMPLGRSYVRVGQKKLPLAVTEGSVFEVSVVATGEQIAKDDELLEANLLDEHTTYTRKVKDEGQDEDASAADEDEEDAD